MIKKLLAKAFAVVRRMNEFWDRDEDKEVSSIISAVIILAGILILKKPILFVIALVLLSNRVIHRFDLWTTWENSIDTDSYDDTMPDIEDVEIADTEKESEFDKPESVTSVEEDESKE